MIKKVSILENIIIVNKHHERGYYTKLGVMLIEKSDGEKYILDLEANADITQAMKTYMEIATTKKQRREFCFVMHCFMNKLISEKI